MLGPLLIDLTADWSFPDSWKGCSALTTLVRSEWSILRQLMLEILLVAGAEITIEVKNVAMEYGRIEAIETMLNWEKGREDKGEPVSLSCLANPCTQCCVRIQ